MLTARLDRDPPTYAPGERLTLTVTTELGERDQRIDTPGTIHVCVPGVGDVDVDIVLRRLEGVLPVEVADSERSWHPVSDDGLTAVFIATA